MKEQALYYCEYQVNAAVVLCADAISDMYFIFCGFHLLYSAYMCVHLSCLRVRLANRLAG